MLLGIGTDIVHVPRVERLLERFGERFPRRILTERELRDFARAPSPARFIAKRFAAKEAFVKALGTGFRDGITWKDIGIGHTPKGQPLIELHGALKGLALKAHVSLADEKDYAVAFVVLAMDKGTA